MNGTVVGRPKLPVTKTLVAVRLAPERRDALNEEAEARETGISDVMRVHLDRYHELEWRDLPSMREAEWCAIFEGMGPPPVQVAGVEWVGATVARAIESSDLAKKWKIDAAALATRARAWTFGQQCAVTDAALRFRRALKRGGDPLEAARAATTRPATLVIAPGGAKRSSRR